MPWWSILIIIFSIALIGFVCLNIFRKIEISKLTKQIIKDQKVFTPKEFFEVYSNLKKDKTKIENVDIAGIYVIFNINKNIYYVGQSVHVVRRVNSHFTGKGNGDVYADFKYGDKFRIKLFKCKKDKLDLIEKYFIKKYNSYNCGYNKNTGNSEN